MADWLRARGYEIIGTNVRLGALELDVVARHGALVVVVEVRTRGSGAYESAFASVGEAKRRRLREATERLWRTMSSDPTIERVRIDVASVDLDATPVTVELSEGLR